MTRPPRAVAFVGVGALGMAVQVGTVWGCLSWGQMHAAVATALGVAAAVVHNFVWHRRWTWGDRELATSTAEAFVRFAAANGTISLIGNVAIVSALVGAVPVNGAIANLIAIGVCAAANYRATDRLVFADRTATDRRTTLAPERIAMIEPCVRPHHASCRSGSPPVW